MEFKKIFDSVLYFLILPFTAISFLLTPLTNDSRIFLGAEAIADTFYSLPYGWDAAYEVKPIGNRILNWILYKFADTFVPFTDNNYFLFGVAVRVVALIILVACCWYISRRILFPYAFPILFLAFACQANFGILMAEWFSVLFSLVAVALCLDDNPNLTLAGGALAFAIALLKSITGLLVIPIIICVYIFKDHPDWVRFFAGYIAAGFAFLILCLTVWPFAISDMLMSRLIAHVGMYPPDTLFTWFWMTQTQSFLPIVMAYYIPIILIGTIAGIALLFFLRSKQEFSAVLLLWLVPTAIVFVQSEFIVYHYIVFMLPAIVSLVMLTRFMSKRKGMAVLCSTVLALFMGYLLVNSAVGQFTTYEYTFWHQKEQNADMINAQFNLTNQTSLLYLDPGDAPFYFHANSSCHYITPMPVERSTDRWNLTALPQFTETYDCIVSYQGEYIVADINKGDFRNYFGEGVMIRPAITGMLVRNYSIVSNASWTIYKKRGGV